MKITIDTRRFDNVTLGQVKKVVTKPVRVTFTLLRFCLAKAAGAAERSLRYTEQKLAEYDRTAADTDSMLEELGKA